MKSSRRREETEEGPDPRTEPGDTRMLWEEEEESVKTEDQGPTSREGGEPEGRAAAPTQGETNRAHSVVPALKELQGYGPHKTGTINKQSP